MGTAFLREALLWGGIALKALLLARLVQLKVAGRYRVVAVCLGFSFVRSLGLLYLSRSGARMLGLNGYAVLYVVSQPVLWALYFLVILELYSLMLEDFRGLRRLGQVVALATLGSATAACGALLIVGQGSGPFRYPFLFYLARQEQSVFLCLSVATLAVVSFVSYYRLPVARNLLILCASFGGYFAVSTALWALYQYLGDDFYQSRTLLNGFFFLTSLLGAVVSLTRAGEAKTQPVSVLWGSSNKEIEIDLLLRLQGMNQTLAKVLRQ